MQSQQTLQILNPNGSLNFTYAGNFGMVGNNFIIDANKYNNIVENDVLITSKQGNITLTSDYGQVNINAGYPGSNAIIFSTTDSNGDGGITNITGAGGYSITTSNGDINLLSQGADINIGVSPIGTPAIQQTQNVNIESFNNLNVSSGDMYFVSSDVISFVSNTGDIQFGTSANGSPVIKFQNGNVLINQQSSTQDYQLDVAITDSSVAHNGYNGVMINSFISNIAADLTLQTSNTLGDSTQCILSLGSFGSDNTEATFQKYLALQTGNTVIRLDGYSYSPNNLSAGFGNDFTIYDIGRTLYWTSSIRETVITGLGTYITATNDPSNVVVSGTYTGTISKTYFIQIDSVGTPNTFTWSNDGGTTFQDIFVPILSAGSPITLENGLQITFTYNTGYTLGQQFIFQAKITAIVNSILPSIGNPEVVYSLQPYHSYIKTTTPSDIVIKTNNNEKMRVTGDGAISIQNPLPNACLDLNSNYNKVLLVNNTISGYQINPSISQLNSGGYVIVWNAQDSLSNLDFNVYGQRYLADGSRNGDNFIVNNITTANQSFPSVAGSNTIDSNHFIVVWSSYDTTVNLYKIKCQIYHNNQPIRNYDISIDSTNPATSNQLNPKVAGLYNGNYIITWSADDTGSGTGIYSIKGIIINDDGNFVSSKLQISSLSNLYNVNYPYVAGLPSNDPYNPSGFVIAYMVAVDNAVDPRYTISVRVFTAPGVASTAEIPITSIGGNNYSNISDGLVSVAEINYAQANYNYNGGFVMAFYRNFLADTSKYSIADNVVGLTSGATAIITALYPAERVITIGTISNRFLVDEEIEITSSSQIIEKIANITYLSNTTANITLDTGSKNVVAYRYNSNLTQSSDALWNIQVNTSDLYSDADRLSGNVNIFQYKRPLACITVDNYGTACATWSNGTIPSVYYQLINVNDGSLIGDEQRLTSQYDGLKQRDQVVTHLQSIQGNDYGFVISWDNQALNLLQTGIYQQLIGYKHALINLEDGNNEFIFTHQGYLGIGTNSPTTQLHVQSRITSAFNDPPNPAGLILQNTSQHIITNRGGLQTISFLNGSSNTIGSIKSLNSLKYDDLYPQPEDLIGFYKFDSTNGTQAIDNSPMASYLNGNLPVYINTSAILENFDIESCWVPGLINNCLIFNGDNNYCFVENTATNGLNTVLEYYKALSLSVWINVPSVVNNGAIYDIVSNGGNFSIAGTYLLSLIDIASNSNMRPVVILSYYNGATTTSIQLTGTITSIINDNKWHHITATIKFDDTAGTFTILLYVDGVLNNSITTTGTLPNILHQNAKTYIGSRNGSNTFYRGYIDELRIYKSILSSNEITDLFSYGNTNSPPKGSIIINANSTTDLNSAVVIDDTGKFNNLNSKPLPFSVLTGELVAYNSNTTITGNGTFFTTELMPGDIIVLDIAGGNEHTVISITNDTLLTLDQRGYDGVETSKPFQSVLRRPSIYSMFDNGDNIKGHIDNYGNMVIGQAHAVSMLEVSGTSNNATNIPYLTLTNKSIEDGQYDRKTAIVFRSYDASDSINPSVNLGHIEVAHDGISSDNKGIMRFFTNTGVGASGSGVENNVMSLTPNGAIGIGGMNSPLAIMHIQNVSTSNNCTLILDSNYNVSPIISTDSVFDERSDIAFAGHTSINETQNPDMYKRYLATITGSNDLNLKTLKGRLDFKTINGDNNNGVESRLSITHQGNVGVNILRPQTLFSVSPEIRLTNNSFNYITGVSLVSGDTLITIDNNIFTTLTTGLRELLIGGVVIIQNDILTTATITQINANNQLTVEGDLTAWNGYQIYIHAPGLNVSNLNSGYGFVGIGTTTPTTSLSVNGAITTSITTITSNITLSVNHYTVICDTTAGDIGVQLPVNGSGVIGRMYRIKNASTSGNNVIVDGNGSNIDGASSFTITYSGGVMGFNTFQSDGTNWWRV